MGYAEPTPIQDEVIPLVRSGKDVVGQAQTGTGKTAAFGIPLVESVDRDTNDPQALILVPTRELAVQVKGELSKLGQHTGVKIIAVYGGQAMSRQLESMRRGVQIIVATPGRLMDHMQRGTVKLGRLRFVVLDEADQMLDIGFAEGGGTLVVDHVTGKAGEDRSQGRSSWPLCHFPIGRGGRAKKLVPENPEHDRRSATKTRSGVGRDNRRDGENDRRGAFR